MLHTKGITPSRGRSPRSPETRAPAGARSMAHRHRARRAGLLAGVATLAAIVAPGAADAAVTAPHRITAFPGGDYISATGYDITQPVTVEIEHPSGAVVGTVTDVLPTENPATPGIGRVDVNGAGGACWQGVTPDVQAGDIVRITNQVTGAVDTSVVRDITASAPVQTAPDTIQVHGTAQDADGNPLPAAELEHRLATPDGSLFSNGRLTLRAIADDSGSGSDGGGNGSDDSATVADSSGPGGSGSNSGHRDGTLSYDAPGSLNWTATYRKLSAADVTLALGAVSRAKWIDPSQPSAETTLFEAGSVAGPAAPCTAPLEEDTPPAPAPVPPPPAPGQPSAGNLYGNPWAADYLANLELGRNNRQVDYRFKAEASSSVSGVRVYFIFGKSGYYAGNGGDVRVTLEPDAGGSPSGTVLASGRVNDPLAQGFRTIPLSSAQLTAGQIYHLRFVNVDPNPTSNWVSLDDLGNSARTSPVQPWVSDSDLAVLYRDGASDSWRHNTGHTPIFTLFDSDGSAHGPGAPYINARSSSGLHRIGGSNKIAEEFTVSGSARTVRSAAFRIKRARGNGGAITMRLATSDGTTIDTATVPESAIDSGTTWVKGGFGSPQTLTPGRSYRLEVSAPAGDSYEAWPLTEGPGFASPTMFRDGAAQVSSNGGSSWSTPSGADDWQFYLGG